jgi:hypothetical protein
MGQCALDGVERDRQQEMKPKRSEANINKNTRKARI